MPKSRLISFCFLMSLYSFLAIAQDTIPESKGDLKYREDQFFIGLTYNLLTDVPSGVVVSGLSGGVQFGFLRDMPINERRNLAIAAGAGFSFEEYGQTLFIGESIDDETIFTVLDRKEVNYNRNRFSTSVIDVPIEFRWRSSTPESYNFWRIYAGFRVGYAYWYKATFKQSNNNIYQTKIPEFNPVRLGATLSFGYSTFNFHVYYSINPFFKDAVTTEGKAVNFKTIKVGLMFYIL